MIFVKKMAGKGVRWSKRALEDNRKLTNYLLNEWGLEITLRVRELITKATDRVEHSPDHFPLIMGKKNIHRCVVSSQTSIFFKVTKTEIVIITLFDNRQNPKKLKL